MEIVSVGIVISRKKIDKLKTRNFFDSTEKVKYFVCDRFENLSGNEDLIISKDVDYTGNFDIRAKLLTSLETQEALKDRMSIYNILRSANCPVPLTVDFSEIACIKFPVILKTQRACGTPESHKMLLLRELKDMEFLKDEIEKMKGQNLIFQEFHEHGSKIIKVFVVGDSNPRHFLRNSSTPANFKFGMFDSQNEPEVVIDQNFPEIDETEISEIKRITKSIRRLLPDLHLFGFDLIRSHRNNSPVKQLLVIDLNYFPTYQELNDFSLMLETLLISERNKRNKL